jgi:hypothetical protein
MAAMREGRNGGKLKSGNTKNVGRPKLPDLKEAIAKVMAEEKDGMSALEAILKALRMKAAKGDVRAAQELLDRGYGKAMQKIEQETTHQFKNLPDWMKGDESEPKASD